MGGLLSSLNAAKSSLTANQKAIEVAGTNIANAGTPGYSRQKAVLSALPTLQFGGFFVGQGVTISTIEREHDVFLTRQIHDKSSGLGEESAKAAPMAELERVFSISGQNLASRIDQFFDSWSELSTNPNGKTERSLVAQEGDLLSRAFKESAANLEGVGKNINSLVASKIDGINSKLREIGELNQRIVEVESSGYPANSDRDRRDLILEELSGSLGVRYFEEDGAVTVTLPGGEPLAQGKDASVLRQERNPDGNLALSLDVGGAVIALDQNRFGGELKGLLSVRDELLPEYSRDLDQLAFSLAEAVNSQHRSGAGLKDDDARDFFSRSSQSAADPQKNAASTLEVNPELLSNPEHVAAGTSPAAGAGAASGDNANALEMAALGEASLDDLGDDTFVGFFSRSVSKVGIEANRISLAQESAEGTLTQLKNLRDGKVGVSIEEEMINLMKFQQGFEATAKFLATVDEMLTSLLSLKR